MFGLSKNSSWFYKVGDCMEFSFFKSAAWQLIRQMDFVAILILLGLFCASVLCIAIIAFKYSAFRKHRIQLKLLLKRLKHTRSLNELVSAGKEFAQSLGGKLLQDNLAAMQMILDAHAAPNQQGLDKNDIDQLELIGNQNLDTLLLEEENHLPILSASASVAPLVGLFGTIWGLIHAFIDISQEKSADIATVAPGMAEALIVTLAGLIVAIPAMIAFFYFSTQLRKFEFYLSEINDTFLQRAKQTFLR
jgi:biopolymer transport protein TolQ